jgi:hypothetical protein
MIDPYPIGLNIGPITQLSTWPNAVPAALNDAVTIGETLFCYAVTNCSYKLHLQTQVTEAQTNLHAE